MTDPQEPTDDRRLAGKEEQFRGAVFVRKAYAPSSPEWEPEHREFCGAEIVERGSHWDTADAVYEGYSTPGPAEAPRDDWSWVCPSCFARYRERLGWTLRRPPGDGNSP